MLSNHLNGVEESTSESIEQVLLKGTETVRALTDALHRDDLQLGLPKEDKKLNLNGTSQNESKKTSTPNGNVSLDFIPI
jgi:hypothetical protein